MERSYRVDQPGRGLPTTRTPGSGIIFSQTCDVTLALFGYHELADDVGPGCDVPRSSFPGSTLAMSASATRPAKSWP